MANRNAQGYFLGSNYIVGALPNSQNTLTGTAQVPLLLEQIVLAGADDSIVTAMRLAGQNLFASNGACPLKIWKNYSFSHKDSSSSISCPIDRNQTFQVSITNGAGGPADFSYAIGTTPLVNPDGSEVLSTPDVNQLGTLLNYVFGFGNFQVCGPGQTTFTATALRNCTLGKLVLCTDQAVAFGELADVTIDSIQVNNIELLSSSATEVMTASTVGVLSQIDLDDALIAYDVELNSTVSITINNRAGAAQNIAMAAYCLPSFSE